MSDRTDIWNLHTGSVVPDQQHLMTHEKVDGAKSEAAELLVRLISTVNSGGDAYREYRKDEINAFAGRFIDALTKYQAFNGLLRA